jgi:hypothetical protein
MGVASLVAPMVVPKLLGPVVPGKGRLGKALLAGAIGVAAATTVADVMRRARALDVDDIDAGADATGAPPVLEQTDVERLSGDLVDRIAALGGVAAVAAGGVAITTAWASRTTGERLWNRRRRSRLTGGSVPAGSRSARRATRSAITVVAIALAAVATSALPYFPLPGVTGPSSFPITSGARRLATPIDRLVIVSWRS